MLRWVDSVLKPYISKAPTNVRTILYLDSYRCHMLHDVIDKIRKLAVKDQHIPAGCTCYCQPVDVVYNKPFKNHIHRLWHDWIKEFGKEKAAIKSPTWAKLAEWIVCANDSMTDVIIKNSLMNHPFHWFDAL